LRNISLKETLSIIGIVLLIGIADKNGIMQVDFAIVAACERCMPPNATIREACLLHSGRS
jgi:multidrug efflux pump subunit AcrB